MNKLTPLILLSLLFFSSHVQAQEKIIEATIVSYECGDNCYLELIGSDDIEHLGLCTATLCEKWNEEVNMPDTFIGQKVRVTIGTAEQYDAEGTVMGTMDAFTQIEILKQSD